MPAGRPTKFSRNLADAICRRIAEGELIRDLDLDPAMPGKTTIFRWIDEKADFREQYARARDRQADSFDEEALARARAAHDKETAIVARLQVDTLQWAAARRAPKRYGARVEQVHSGGDNPLKFEDVSARDLIESKLSGLAARLPPGE